MTTTATIKNSKEMSNQDSAAKSWMRSTNGKIQETQRQLLYDFWNRRGGVQPLQNECQAMADLFEVPRSKIVNWFNRIRSIRRNNSDNNNNNNNNSNPNDDDNSFSFLITT